jgi:hypothetical protein
VIVMRRDRVKIGGGGGGTYTRDRCMDISHGLVGWPNVQLAQHSAVLPLQ